MVWHTAQIGTAYRPAVYRSQPSYMGGTMTRTGQSMYAPQRSTPTRFAVSPARRYALRKAQVYDMSDELEQFEEATEHVGRHKPMARILSDAFERNWRNRAQKFIAPF